MAATRGWTPACKVGFVVSITTAALFAREDQVEDHLLVTQKGAGSIPVAGAEGTVG